MLESNYKTLDKNTKTIKVTNGEPNCVIDNNNEGITGEQTAKGTDLFGGISNLLPGSVKDFYSGTSVFVTGGTGFLGKAILEKLLRSCEGIKSIYILLRQKKGQDLHQRHVALLENEIFDNIRQKWPERLSKIKLVSGDVSLPELGLSPLDCKLLVEEVNIVIHSAATVRFDELLTKALTLNTLGTKRIIELCHRIKNIKSIVHVSTAYSNSDTNFEILEKFYPVNLDVDFLLQCSATLSQEVLDIITPQIRGYHANTYTLTKALGEQIILKYAKGLPICIFRPSIITAAYQEPFPGWIDNIFGPTGIMTEISRGTIRSVMCRSDIIVDLIPVDLAVNACISAAWHHTNYKTPEPIIYNCTTGSSNPLTWSELAKHTLRHAIESPTQQVLLYPNFAYTKSAIVHCFWKLTAHYLPSLVFDMQQRTQGKKPVSMKISKKINNAIETCRYFAMNQFIFRNSNMACLVKDLRATEEYSEFFSDVKSFHWETYIGIYTRGIRKYVLRDSLDTMPAAKRKIRRLYWINIFIKFISGYLVVKMLQSFWARLMRFSGK